MNYIKKQFQDLLCALANYFARTPFQTLCLRIVTNSMDCIVSICSVYWNAYEISRHLQQCQMEFSLPDLEAKVLLVALSRHHWNFSSSKMWFTVLLTWSQPSNTSGWAGIFFFCAVSLLVRILKLGEMLLNITKEQNLWPSSLYLSREELKTREIKDNSLKRR